MTAEPVAWDLAAKVAVRVGGRDPFERSYHLDSLAPDFEELTAEAEALVTEETGLVPPSPARARVVDRADWVHANVASFRRLLAPLTDRLGDRLPSTGLAATATRTVTAVELGTMLGWMSTRVLGQYDLLLVEGEDEEHQDLVYYVGPNVLALEKRFAFPPREFRLWLALHEVTHRAQFTGVPWLRPHFLSLVQRSLDAVDPDPKRFVDALGRVVEDMRSGRNPLDEGGIAALLAGPEQRDLFGRIGGMMSLLEGHGDVTMDRAGADQIPNAERFGQVLRQHRQQLNPATKFLQKLIGLEAKMKQYEQGEQFIEAVESVGGTALLDRAWETPEHLPLLTEIRNPDAWIDRIRATAPLAS